MTTRILSIDGGGIRGMIPAVILRELEDRTGKAVADMFDIIAGTSTGGILACGLSAPDDQGEPAHSAEKVVKIYENDGPEIFDRNAARTISAGGNVFRAKYPSIDLQQVLQRKVGDAPLSEALTDVVVPCYELSDRRPLVFKSSTAEHNSRLDQPLWRVAMATSVAPTYFEPYRITFNPEDRWVLVDGGLYAGNPAMQAVTEALDQGADLDDLFVVSIGTGDHDDSISYEESRGWGLAGWVRPIIESSLDGTSDAVDNQCSQLLDDDYIRLQTTLQEDHLPMDDASTDNLLGLETAAKNLMEQRSGDMARIEQRVC